MNDRTPTEATWKLVPTEPTAEMIEAHFKAHAEAETVFAEVPDIWRAMLAASPPAPAAEPVAFNINETVLVRLTERGREIVRQRDAELVQAYPVLSGSLSRPEEDADGWSKWQLWYLMKTSGPHMHAGATNPFDITIRIPSAHPIDAAAIRAEARREAASLVKQFEPGGDEYDWDRDADSMREAIYNALIALADKGEAE